MSPPASSLPIERWRLDNGLRVVLHRDSSLPLVAINLWYHVGSKNERPGHTGFAHLFEHMLFQGSRNVGTNDHFRWVQQVGGVANGSTSWDRTNYYETLPANCLDLGLWLESDRLADLLPAMTEEKLANQREVVSNERRQRIDNQPYGRAFECLMELLFPAPHPYHWPVIGYPQDVAAASLPDVASFFRTWYVPDNAVLTVAGDLEPEPTLRRIEQYFGAIPAGGQPPRPDAPAVADGERLQVLEDEVELARTYLAFRAPPVTAAGWHAGDVVATLLAGGKSSPLHRDLVHERQLAQDVSAFVLPNELQGVFVVVATARPEVEIERLEAEIDDHLRRAAERPPAAADLERAHNRIRTSYSRELQTVERRADLLSRFTTYFDEPERIGTEVDRYLAVDAEAAHAWAAAHLRSEKRAAVRVVPGGAEP